MSQDSLNSTSRDCGDESPHSLGLASALTCDCNLDPRFASYTQDQSLAQNVIAFTILTDGIPIIYAGQEQHYAGGNDPSNREATWLSGYNTQAPLYTHVAQLNQIRARAIAQDATYLTYQSYPIYTDTSTIAMRKGFDGNQIVSVLSNLGSGGANYTLQLTGSGFAAGSTVVEILSCTDITVDGSGTVPVDMSGGAPRVSHRHLTFTVPSSSFWQILYPQAQLSGSGICGN